MYRTQILLDPEQHKTLVEIARQEKSSLSEVVRKIVSPKPTITKAIKTK